MKTTMLNLIKEAVKKPENIKTIEGIYDLYDRLLFCENLEEMANTLVDWLCKKYSIQNIKFSLYDMESEKNTIIVQNGVEFFLDDEFSFYFIINTHTDLNAVVSFAVDTKEQYENISKDQNIIDSTFFIISAILQNGIMKKHHIESSSVDSVTNVHDRKYLIKHIQKIISLSNKTEENISFLMVGIDRFKAVIEEFDYDIGDKVLIELAKVIHSVIRDYDIVARLTGDEFLVALVNLKSKDEAEVIAQRLIQEFAKAKIVVEEDTNQVLQKTICIGISSFPYDSEDINQVLKNADNFLNEAKNKGRGQFAVYTHEENSSVDLF